MGHVRDDGTVREKAVFVGKRENNSTSSSEPGWMAS